MLGFRRSANETERNTVERSVRHSRAWAETYKFLKSREGLRVLDCGPTSPANINFLTELGHSVYMANPVSDAAAPEWRKPLEPGAKEPAEFDVERFCAAALNFSGRVFDVVLLWDTANYLPTELGPPFFQRLHDVLQPGGRLVAFFHPKKEGPDTVFSRYQLSEKDDLAVLRSGSFPIQALYQSRQIERFLEGYEDIRFFLAKDNVRELYAIR